MVPALVGQEFTDTDAKGDWWLISSAILLSQIHQRFRLQPVKARQEHTGSLSG
ncbi:hypothetical protein SAMN04489707_10529 [Paenacidovorax caeni]|uniref:Uncharacterized protein n=1 Tax=Paenacidovorax caeni TaxID=343013 RepID=A0A1I7KHX3_9BURK|nr:hypothetical protein SAMN04489707_10529 [Paenacidovorax caeni]